MVIYWSLDTLLFYIPNQHLCCSLLLSASLTVVLYQSPAFCYNMYLTSLPVVLSSLYSPPCCSLFVIRLLVAWHIPYSNSPPCCLLLTTASVLFSIGHQGFRWYSHLTSTYTVFPPHVVLPRLPDSLLFYTPNQHPCCPPLLVLTSFTIVLYWLPDPSLFYIQTNLHVVFLLHATCIARE